MKILAVDCSSTSLSICIAKDDHILFSSYFNVKKTHSETIMPQIEYALDKVKFSVSDIDVFGVTVGPGSYTGLRIGVSTIKAFAHATNKPIAAISSLKTLATSANNGSKYICPILDARNDQVYSALYSNDNYTLNSEIEDSAFNIDELIFNIHSVAPEKSIVFIGDGALYHSTKIKKAFGEKAIIANAYSSIIDSKNVALLTRVCALNNELINYLELEPIYLKKTQAERELNNK